MTASASQSSPSRNRAMPIRPGPLEVFKAATSLAKAFSQHLGAVLLAGVISPANAALDMGRCCQIRARQLIIELDENPWTACSIGVTITDPLTQIYASVNATKAWAMQNCPGYQLSSLDQWLEPLVQWLTPYLTLLLLCPIGENADGSEREKTKGGKGLMWYVDWVLLKCCTTCLELEDAKEYGQENFSKKVLEWMNILGDPASAIWGATSQLWMDFWAVKTLWGIRGRADHPGRLNNNNDMLLGVAIIGSQTPMDDHWGKELANNFNSKVHQSGFAERLEGEIWTVLAAGTNFANGILLPVVFHFVLTAWGFYKAYQKLGDNDTAHSLAYGALYSWLLILVVVGNCFAARANISAVKSSMRVFPLPGIREPLRRRFSNTVKWRCWLPDIDESTGLMKGATGDRSNEAASVKAFGWRFYYKYLLGQFAGWACVAFFGSCAIVISYTTPTVGWGCRSFNHLLYILLSLVVASLEVLRHWVERKYAARSDTKTAKKVTPLILITRWIYTLAVSVNAFVLLGGTVFHFCGIYRSYGCSRIFGPRDALLQLASHTELHVHNSQHYWYSTGYVAYCGAWAICALAVAFRQYIQIGLQRCFANAKGTVGGENPSAENENEEVGEKVLTKDSNVHSLEIDKAGESDNGMKG